MAAFTFFVGSLENLGDQYKLHTVRPWDARFLGQGKIGVAQNSCNFCYLIDGGQDHQKNVQLKVFNT